MSHSWLAFKIKYSATSLSRQVAKYFIFSDSSPPAGGGRATIMYYVYVIYNKKHKKIYIGQCENVPIRLDQHNNKFFNKCYTARFDGNWELIHQEEYNTRIEALKREKQLKVIEEESS